MWIWGIFQTFASWHLERSGRETPAVRLTATRSIRKGSRGDAEARREAGWVVRLRSAEGGLSSPGLTEAGYNDSESSRLVFFAILASFCG